MAFNVLDYVQGSLYPSKEANVYLDGNARSRLTHLQDELKVGVTKTREAEIKKQIKAHREALEKSKLVFYFQGFAPHVRQTLSEAVRAEGEKKKWDNDRIQQETTNRILAKAIVKVENSDGEVDDHEWTGEEVEKLMEVAPNGALNEFISAGVHVTAEALKFDQGVDVPF